MSRAEAEHLGLGRRPGLENHIRLYRNGRDLTGTPRGVMVIDLFGLDPDVVRKRFPEVYQHILERVKPERDINPRPYRRLKWWLFGENNPDFRKALIGLPRYIATVETAKHRVFRFLDASILPDNKLVCVGLADAYYFGVLIFAKSVRGVDGSGDAARRQIDRREFRQGGKSSLPLPPFWPPLRAWVNSTPAMARGSRRAVAGDAI